MEFSQIVELSSGEKYSYPDVFNDTCGLDVIVKDGYHPQGYWIRRGINRRAVLHITSFVGVSSNAEHYYGEIKIDGVWQHNNQNPSRSTSSSEFAKINPLSDTSYTLTLHRRVTQDDKDKDKEARRQADVKFEWQDVGDKTYRFNSIDDLTNFANIVFKTRFSGKWDFYVYIRGRMSKVEID